MNKYCPLIKKKCIQDKCAFWMHVLGRDPATNNPIDHFDCTIRWLPTLIIENSNQTRMGAASVDKVATEVAKVKVNMKHQTAVMGIMPLTNEQETKAIQGQAIGVLQIEAQNGNGNG